MPDAAVFPSRQRTKCNAGCGRVFKVTLTERPDGDEGAVVQEFTCPYCAKVYPVIRITARGLELRKGLRERLEEATPAQRPRILAEFQRETTRLSTGGTPGTAGPNREQRRQMKKLRGRRG